MAFDWKGFLKPSWKKVAAMVLIYYFFALPLFICMVNEWFGHPTPGGTSYSCISSIERIFAEPVQYLHDMTQDMLKAGVSPFYILLWIILLFSYLISCALVHFYQKYAKKR